MTTPSASLAFIAFFDVLGFKKIVESNEHEKVAKVHELLLTMIQHAIAQGAFVHGKDQSGTPVVHADLSKAKVHYALISDSVLLWTSDAGKKSFIDIVAVARHIAAGTLYCGLPLRGAIGIGPLSFIDRDARGAMVGRTLALVGKGLVQAFEFEKSQQWAGCVIADECIQHYEESIGPHKDNPDVVTISYLVEKRIIRRYRVPFKGAYREHWVLDWAWATKDRPEEKMVRESFTMHRKSIDAPEVRSLIEETIDFLRETRPSDTAG